MEQGLYYAFLEQAETAGDHTLLRFECVRVEAVDSVLRQTIRPESEWFADLPTHVLVLGLAADGRRRAQSELPENAWYRLAIGPNEVLPATGYSEGRRDEGEEGVRLLAGWPVRLGETDSGQISRLFGLESVPPASEGDLRDLLGKTVHHVPEFVAAYKVGQGNCNAVCDGHGAPVVYFDFGAGCYQNAKTSPWKRRARPRFCLTYTPPIILSHWDMDHYYLARSMVPEAREMPWVVPLQPMGPATRQFAGRLQMRGNLHVWPPTLSHLDTPVGRVIRCGGPSANRNDSGLALLAEVPVWYLPDREPILQRCLLPGDCGYAHIGPYGARALDALVATHHGGAFQGKPPLPRGAGRTITYSAGRGNTYGHPTAQALGAHRSAGWLRALSTQGGHIALCWQGPGMPGLGCCGSACDLGIKQV